MADAAQIIGRVRSHGANITIENDRLRIIKKENLPDGALDFIQKHAREIASFVEHEGDIEERAAIMEFDGGLSREAADKFSRILFSSPPPDVDAADWTWFVGKAVKVLEASGMIVEAA